MYFNKIDSYAQFHTISVSLRFLPFSVGPFPKPFNSLPASGLLQFGLFWRFQDQHALHALHEAG